VGRHDLVTIANKVTRILEDTPFSLLHMTLQPLLFDKEHGLKRDSNPKVCKTNNKVRPNKPNRASSEYNKSVQAKMLEDNFKGLPRKETMKR